MKHGFGNLSTNFRNPCFLRFSYGEMGRMHNDSPTECTVSPRPETLWEVHFAELGCPPGILLAGVHLTEAEAQALAARGLLAPILHRVYSSSAPSPQLRGYAAGLHLRALSRRRSVLHRLTAAWIYGCAAPPRYLECTVNGNDGHKFGAQELRYVRHRYLSYSRFEVNRVGPVLVTTPLRTCVDLAAFDATPAGDSALATFIRAPSLGCSPRVLCAALAAVPRLKFRRQAIERVHQLAPKVS